MKACANAFTARTPARITPRKNLLLMPWSISPIRAGRHDERPGSVVQRIYRLARHGAKGEALRAPDDHDRRRLPDALVGKLAVEVIDGRNGLPVELDQQVALLEAGTLGRRSAPRK